MNSAHYADLQLIQRQLDRTSNDRQGVELGHSRGDVNLVSGKDNVAQAIMNRLLTRQGELANLGHPDYGSRLHHLIGEPQTPRTRALAELYVRECLAQESRITEITRFVIQPQNRDPASRSILNIDLHLTLVDNDTGSTETLQLETLQLLVPVAL